MTVSSVARQLGYALLTMLLVTILVFLALQALPGDLASQVLGKDATPEAKDALRAQLHLDDPGWQRYLSWLGGVLHGDFGHSLVSEKSVLSEVALPLRNSAVLALIVVVIGVTVAVGLGVIAGLTRGRWPDAVISGVALVAMSVPEFTVATLLVLLFAIKLMWFPAVVTDGPTATLSQLLPAMWLPAAALIIAMSSYIIRMMRTSVIDVMASDYIAMAGIRGLSRPRILLLHMIPNAILPTLNIIAINIAYLVGGVVVVEAVFNYPGIGTTLVNAVHVRDLPVLQFVALMSAMLFIVCNLLADVAATFLNPRMRTPGRAR
ncbi:ABC transporter permease [Nocardioides sp.]|uniref:ABC transporter permease n=1 Tax=Nocardioides sp. TaxID=35761 RepID=UPI0039E3352B